MGKAKPKSKGKTSKSKLTNKFKTKKSKGNVKRNAASQKGKNPRTTEERQVKPRAVPYVQKNHSNQQNGLDERFSFQRVIDNKSLAFDDEGNYLRSTDGSSRRKRNNSGGNEADYEIAPREASDLAEADIESAGTLLPVKNKFGVFKRQKILPASDHENSQENEAEEIQSPETEPEKPTEPSSVSVIELYASRQQQIARQTSRIAHAAQSIIENPTQNIELLDTILRIAQSPKESVLLRKRALLSLVEIFKDIIPGYRIRPLTDAEQNAKISKDVKHLRSFESSLLLHYKTYLELLDSIITASTNKSNKGKNSTDAATRVNLKVALIATKCLSELLLTKSHFNYRINILTALITRLNLSNDLMEIGDICITTLKSLFREDISGQVSLEAVQIISRMTKSKLEHVRPQVLESFLSLRINPDLLKFARDKETKAERLKRISKERNTLSRKERKRKKASVKLESELKEVEAADDMSDKKKTQTEILKLVFAVYFRVLKLDSRSPLLAPTLKGLSKFAQLINVDFFNDLFSRLKALMASQDLTLTESLNCVLTAFTILSGQGEAFNLDPHQFYIHLYNILLEFNARSSMDDVTSCIKCLDLMLIKRRRQVSPSRLLAFSKRIAIVAVSLHPQHTIMFLSLVMEIAAVNSKTESLFDNETAARGVYRADLTDPEHCNADCTKLWDLCLLRHHFMKDVNDIASSLANVKSSLMSNKQMKSGQTSQTEETEIEVYFPQRLTSTLKSYTSNPRQRQWIHSTLLKTVNSYDNAEESATFSVSENDLNF